MASTAASEIIDHTYDAVVVGAGGSGLRATLGIAEAGLTHRLHHQGLPDPLATPSRRRAASPPRSATWAPDDWRWHMYDTVKGSDWLGDQDAIEYMCREAIRRRSIELEHCGVPFSAHRGRQASTSARSAA
jgi:succinate dehydrogenase / fumarate reductase flavoprotein subunit